MKTIGKWYVIVAVLVFTFCMPIKGHTPAGWALKGVTFVVNNVPHLSASL